MSHSDTGKGGYSFRGRGDRMFGFVNPKSVRTMALVLSVVLGSLGVFSFLTYAGATTNPASQSISTETAAPTELLRSSASVDAAQLPETPWMSGGPYGAPIRKILFSPVYSEDHLVFASTWGSGIFRMNDNLGIWESRNQGLDTPRLMALAISPDFAHDGTLFAAPHGGTVYSTTNGGETWQLADDGLPWRSIRALAVSPGYAQDGTVYAGVNDSGVYRTLDRGQSWFSVTTGLPITTVIRLAIHPRFPMTSQLYALTEAYTLYRSDDGASWSACAALPDGHVAHSMAFAPSGETVFVGSCNGLYYSADRCLSWQAVEGIEAIRIDIDEVLVSPNFDADETLWVASHCGGRLYRSMDGGITWSQAISTASYPIGLAASPAFAQDGTLFVGDIGGNGGVYRSTDRGDTWEARSTGMTWNVIEIAASPGYDRDSTVFVGPNGGGIFRSEDGGISWEPVNDTYPLGADADALALSPHYSVDGVVFAAGYGTGMYRSQDRGDTWTQVGMADVYAITEMAIAPAETLTDALILVGTLEKGAYRSVDGGWTWQPITVGLVVSRVNEIAFSPAYTNDTTVFVTTDGSGIFRSEDGGQTWLTVTNEITNSYIWAVGVSPNFANDGTLLVSNCDGLFRSRDRGESWEHLIFSTEYSVSEIAFSPHYAVDQTIWVATTQWSQESEGGVFVSQDGGDTWQPFNNGLTQLEHFALTTAKTDSSGYDVFVGTTLRSVWQHRISSVTLPWAVFVYINSDNDHLDQHTPKLFNRLELAVANDPSLDVRVLWDRIGEGNTVLYDVQPDPSVLLLADYVEGENKWSLGELNLGDPLTLWQFIADARMAYPARYHLLAIVDHGGGWSPELRAAQRSSERYRYGASGFSWDVTNAYSYLSTQDIGIIFSQETLVSDPIDVLFYDACLMGMVEEAYEIRRGARYLVASENETWSSFPYDDYLDGIQTRTPAEQAAWMVDEYHESLIGDPYPYTLTAIDLERTGVLSTALDSLAVALSNHIPQDSWLITTTFLAAQKLDYNADLVISNTEGYVDLGDFVVRLAEAFPDSDISDAVTEVLDALTDSATPMIIRERHQSGSTGWPYETYMDVEDATGLSIYLPLGEPDPDLLFYRHDQLTFAHDTLWDEFIYELLGVVPQLPPHDWVGGRGKQPYPLSPAYSVFLPLVIKEQP